MLQEESDLALIIAQIVQKLKGSNLYAQLERQAWVSEAEWEGMETSGAVAVLRPPSAPRWPKPKPVSGLSSSAPGQGKASLPGVSSTCSVSGVRVIDFFFFKRKVGHVTPFFRPENRWGYSFIL